MYAERKIIPDELLQKLSEALGETSLPEMEGPGVYYLPNKEHGEFYIMLWTWSSQ